MVSNIYGRGFQKVENALNKHGVFIKTLKQSRSRILFGKNQQG